MQCLTTVLIDYLIMVHFLTIENFFTLVHYLFMVLIVTLPGYSLVAPYNYWP